MIRQPIAQRTRIILAISSICLLVLLYSWLSYRQHQRNENDTTIPNLGQFVEGWKRILTPEGLTDILENYALLVEEKDLRTGKKTRIDRSTRSSADRELDGLLDKATGWTFERAAGVAGVEVADLRRLAAAYEKANPALIRCGWGLERNRNGGQAVAVKVNVLQRAEVQTAFDECIAAFGHIDILINGAGGNKKEATCVPPESFFWDLDEEAIRWVFDLNCLGTMISSQIFGEQMANRKTGTIINISSMNAYTPLTRIAAYSAAKAAISNFTQWLATYMAQNHSPNIRVNAIAPGFFLTDQNRFLLTNEDGSTTQITISFLNYCR